MRAGFFAWADADPETGYEPYRGAANRAGTVTLRPRRTRAGRRAHRDATAPPCSNRSWAIGRAWSPVENRFFGGNVGVAGLLVGEDLARVLAAEPAGHRYLLPDVCLSQGRFLDGTLARGPAPARRGACPPTGWRSAQALA